MTQLANLKPRSWFALTRLRISLRGLMVLVLVVGVGFGWPIAAAHRQAETVALIRQARNPAVHYDWETSSGKSWREGGHPACPHWLCARAGPHFLHPVTAVDLWSRADDPLAERIGSLRRLEWLNVTESSRFSDAGLAACAGLTQLNTLFMSNTAVTSAGMRSLRQLTHLETLEMWGTPLGDADLCHLGSLLELDHLGLTGDRLTDAGLAHLAPLTRLESLDLDSAGPLAITTQGLVHLSGMKHLRRLILPGTRIADLEPIHALAQLAALNVNGSPLTDRGIAVLADLPNLTYVDLSRTAITDAGFDVLARCPKLDRVELDGTAVTDAGLDRFRHARPGVQVRRSTPAR